MEHNAAASPDPENLQKHDLRGLTNDEGLNAMQIIGRCSKCSNHGTIDPVKHKLPSHVIDAMLSYKIVPRIFCRVCMKATEFIPTEVKKHRDVPFLKSMQDYVKNGIQPLPEKVLDADGNVIIVDKMGNPLER